MKNVLLGAVAIVAIGVASTSANAVTPLLSDDFNGYGSADQLNWIPPAMSNWLSPDSGSVDLIGAGGSFDFYPGNGQYIDLAGSTGAPGTFSTAMIFGPGTYILSFDLGGSHRDDVDKTTYVNLGPYLQPFKLAATDGLTPYSIKITIGLGEDSRLSFADLQNEGNGNIGNILDNVSVTAVPEPATWAMMLLGFAALGFAGYRGASAKGNRTITAG